ncbi:EF-hand domain-containing protein [Ramlibacter pallidus]|uniref:EF-hand domain-containing protein n=1 Tax=Ramlibacter pallidus TaxID=2780087 RepID=A0ABR9S636_9BURK|nr:EF-hand domain-containing protein [Ramlibacter pallidus]MBE7368980.1 EF-hand domain-containing protein [Ramlibacter pallidus]
MKTRTAWIVLLLVATLSGCARGQGQRAARMAHDLEQRFALADRDRDGRLTRDEARAGLPWAERNFDAIDTARAGTIDLGQVKAFARAELAQKRAGGGRMQSAP